MATAAEDALKEYYDTAFNLKVVEYAKSVTNKGELQPHSFCFDWKSVREKKYCPLS